VKGITGSARRFGGTAPHQALGRTPAPIDWQPAARIIPARVVIRPARPDDLGDATLLERRVWGRMAATLNELQRRLFALPESFLMAEMQRPGLEPLIVGLANGVIWTRDYPRVVADIERLPASASHNPRGDVLYVASVGVDPEWRGRGIGLRILQEVAVVGRRRHLKFLRLIANNRGQRLCTRAGFQSSRPLPELFRQQRDLMPQPALVELSLF
jgi:GNAT superfamily N-acetyltransferase